MAKTLDDLSMEIPPADAHEGVEVAEVAIDGQRWYRRASADGVVVHCFVDAHELRRLLAVMVVTELAGAMIRAELSG